MDNQPIPLLGRPADGNTLRNCENCAFAKKEQLPPPHIGSMHRCLFFPPQVVVMPQHGQLTLTTMFPPVNASMLCQQHALKEEIENAPQVKPNG